MTIKYRLITGIILFHLVISTYSCITHNKLFRSKVSNGLSVISVQQFTRPVFINSSGNLVLKATVKNQNTSIKSGLKRISVMFSDGSSVSELSDIKIICGNTSSDTTEIESPGSLVIVGNKISKSCSYTFREGENYISLSLILKKNASLSGKLRILELKMEVDDGTVITSPNVVFPELRFATKLRRAGQDNCNTYRIPGIITTNKGSLIAVYDNRYNSSKDLQEDIDIGMSRSTDGGETWEPMKVIMDMGTYGGLPQRRNGTGDPCILYDTRNGVIWVASLWMSGAEPDQMLWWVSKPGMAPEVTGQFIVVKSTDDGLTWSDPINITPQIKLPEWQLLLQGPGRGITMKDGTLVFPAQFKADMATKAIDGGQYTCQSAIVYSCDGGSTWNIGTGAKSNTTESQVVELSDGTLMLNMRDDRNRSDKGTTNGRAVATSNDLGKTWITHPTSNSTLPEPNCQASLISADLNIAGTVKKVLFFSNPANKAERTDMTIKASLDEGMSWPEKYQLLLTQEEGYGYSCMTMINDECIGILYEGEKELIFQKIAVKDLLKGIK
jgi:sialidase-1